MSTDPAAARTVLCLGDGIVDLISERHAVDPAHVVELVPHVGGVAVNIAVLAARAGASVAIAGAAGEDRWGAWVRDRLDAERVATDRFTLVGGARTQVAIVTVDAAGEAGYDLYGEPIAGVVHALGPNAADLAAAHGALLITSNTLVLPAEREVTMAARAAAVEHGRPVVFDANLRLHRWSSRADAAASANACVPGAILVRATADEATLMTGEEDPERAAQALRKGGAANVVISLGSGGAILRGRVRADVGAPAVSGLASTVGAGDAFTATLVARLAASGFYEPAIAAGLRDAARAAAAACERWGALD